jgi:hypothetical protein
VVDARPGVTFAMTLGAADGFEAACFEDSDRPKLGVFDLRSGLFWEEAFNAARACRGPAASSCRSRPAVL